MFPMLIIEKSRYPSYSPLHEAPVPNCSFIYRTTDVGSRRALAARMICHEEPQCHLAPLLDIRTTLTYP